MLSSKFLSNTPMHPDNPINATDHRLTELKIKASFNEDLLVRQIEGLRQQMPEVGSGVASRMSDDLPPHY